MSRRTVTITAPNGVKVRTVASKTYFVVNTATVTHEYVPFTNAEPGHWAKLPEPRDEAAVVLRTDSASAAWAMVRKHSGATVYRYSPTAAEGYQVLPLTRNEIQVRANRERQDKQFAARVGNNGEARRNFY